MEEESTRQSRLFVILAIALVGLLVLGLLGIGGVFVIRQNLEEQAAVVQATPTLMIRLPEPSATFTPIKVASTSTPAPTPTNTPVMDPSSRARGEEAAVGSGSDSSGGDAGADSSSVEADAQDGPRLPLPQSRAGSNPVAGASEAGASETPSTVPDTGLGALEAILIAAGLILVLFVARRMRMSL